MTHESIEIPATRISRFALGKAQPKICRELRNLSWNLMVYARGFLWECRSANTGFTSALCRKTEKERKRKERESVKGRESETGTASRLVRVRISSRIREKSSKRVLVPGRAARYRSQYRAFPFLLSKRPYTQGRPTTEITARRRSSGSRPILRTFSRANIAE